VIAWVGLGMLSLVVADLLTPTPAPLSLIVTASAFLLVSGVAYGLGRWSV
jgi:hypothetical protein